MVKMQEHENYYRALFNNQTNAIAVHEMVYDDEGFPVDFIYIDGNDLLDEIMGMERDTYLNKKVSEVIPGFTDTHKDLFDTYSKVAETGKSAQFELYFDTFDRWYRVKAYSHKKGYFVTISDDISEQKKILSEIENAKKLNETLVETSPFGIILYDNAGDCIMANKMAGKVLNGSREQLLSQNFHEIEFWKKGRLYKDALWTLKTGDQTTNVEEVKTMFGKTLWLEYIFVRLIYDNKLHLVIRFKDVSEHIEQQNALKQSVELYRNIAKNFPNGSLLLFDFEMRYILADGKGLEEVGLTKQHLEGRTIYDVFPYEVIQSIEPPYKNALMGESSIKEILYKDKVYMTYHSPILSEEGKVICGMVMTQDITELKLKTIQLAESERRYKNMFFENKSVMLMLDPKTGQIVDANDAASNFYGYSREELTNMNISKINTLSDKEIKKEMNNVLENKQPFFQFKHRLKNGKIRDVQVYSGKIMFFEKELLYSIVHDNTNEIKALEKLKKQTISLIQSEKMSAMGTLIAGVSHELNNPLMGILNYTDYCLKHVPQNNKSYPVLLDIKEEAEKSAEIVKGLLTFSRKEEADNDFDYKTDLIKSIEAVVKILELKIKNKDILVQLPEKKEPFFSTISLSYLQQVLFNILHNAIYAVEKSEKKVIKIDVKKQSNSNIIQISDTGNGIAAKQGENIFDPFFTTKPVGEGTGLGLSICKNILTDAGGDISFKSKPGQGTTFIIKLPISNNLK